MEYSITQTLNSILDFIGWIVDRVTWFYNQR